MKKLMTIALLTSLFSVASYAKEVKVFETWDSYADISASFDVNPALGRAWVVVEIDSAPMDPDWDPEERRVKVEGLTYDVDSKSVIYTDETSSVVCMEEVSRGRGIFRRTFLQTTGNCTFTQKIVTKYVDDGFHVKKKKYAQTILNIIK